jgi:hypothetical protein
MILFLNEERAYLSWVAHHRKGYVLDGRHKPRLAQLALHRATCPTIKSAPSRRFHFTTGAKLKACSLDRHELAAWVAAQSGPAIAECVDCRPASDAPPAPGGNGHLSKLGREILDYVLDAAVIHFEHEYPPYRLSIADVAACFGKTPGQLRPALARLTEDGFLVWAGPTHGASSALHQMLLPTGLALRTLPAFRDESDAAIAAELSKLDPPR